MAAGRRTGRLPLRRSLSAKALRAWIRAARGAWYVHRYSSTTASLHFITGNLRAGLIIT